MMFVELPYSDIPSYIITRRQDLCFQFAPPAGSLELATALSFKYPLELDLETKMRRAIMEFVNEEHATMAGLFFNNYQQPSPGPVPPESTPMVLDSVLSTEWDIVTGRPTEKKRKKTAYDPIKRKKVAKVRKRVACENCRRRKVECKRSSATETCPAPTANFANDSAEATAQLQSREQ